MKNLTIVPFLLLTSACSFFMGQPQPEPGQTAASATTQRASATPPVASSEPPAAETAAPAASPPKASKIFSLTEHKLPLSIELPEDAKVEASQSKDGLGGARISHSNISLRILKADARMATIAAAKASLAKIINPAKTFYKEEKDLLVYDRGDDDRYFLMLVKVGGVTYACQDLGGEPSEAALEPGIAACRTLKKAP